MGFKHIWLWLAALLLLVGVAGCGGGASDVSEDAGDTTEEAPAEQPDDATESDEDYPYPFGMLPTRVPPYPEGGSQPTPEGRDPEPIPTAAAETGVVHGNLFNIDTDEPLYDGVTVFLSQVILTEDEEMEVVTLDRSVDPNVTPDIEGGFAFGEVPPGRYGIVVQGPLNQYVARYADDQGEDVVITVEAGGTVDVGKVYTGFP